MTRPSFLYGNEALLDEYNERVDKKLNTKSSVTEGKSSQTIGFIRGIEQMALDLQTYYPYNSYLDTCCIIGGMFAAKKEFYRLILLLLSDLGLIFGVRSPSPWEVISELRTIGVIGDSEITNIKVCLSIANEIRLKTYFANDGQKELFSPVPQYGNITEEPNDAPIFRDFGDDLVVRLLSTSFNMHQRCVEFYSKYMEQNEIDISILRNPFLQYSKEFFMGQFYIRMQNFPKALEWMKSIPEDSREYAHSLDQQSGIYLHYGEHEKSIECSEKALEVHYQNEEMSSLNVVKGIHNLAAALLVAGQYEKAKIRLEEAIGKHNEIYGQSFLTIELCVLMRHLGSVYSNLGQKILAFETYKKVEQMQHRLRGVPDAEVISLYSDMATLLTEIDRHSQSLAMEYMEKSVANLSQDIWQK